LNAIAALTRVATVPRSRIDSAGRPPAFIGESPRSSESNEWPELFFDKTLSTNWNLPWHQDLTIAVRTRRDVDGFGPWTRKAGIPHVHAPAELLERMVTLRLHLDDCGPQSGPMRVLPGSHTVGKLNPGAVASWSARAGELAVDCIVPAGGVVVMRPLLLHASASGTSEGHRRVIHLEYAAEPLPDGLEWYENGVDAKSVVTMV
jgi:hypothetical protein